MNEQDIIARIGLVLRTGVLVSAFLLLFGGVIYLVRHGVEAAPDRGTFTPPEFAQPGRVVEAALEGRGRAIIQLGIFVLLATPVLRVAYSILAFARRRDLLYVLLPLLVLVVLLAGYFFKPR